ncbi:hypothetical protein ERJ75_000896400 [Trypanosoma vivax]|nr:hypothetical protein ERJ75_000897100 [Trypanosoma vivax]KAH8612372.1 hypothetical protein ERJ75_000896800 [Trypanosoma vivax]KAH8612375.1 hypothetical protein ERJ75_000896400 [Trypanosoma vivax]
MEGRTQTSAPGDKDVVQERRTGVRNDVGGSSAARMRRTPGADSGASRPVVSGWRWRARCFGPERGEEVTGYECDPQGCGKQRWGTENDKDDKAMDDLQRIEGVALGRQRPGTQRQ